MTVQELKDLMERGEFHHASYRDQGTIWEGLWIYANNEDGFRGFTVVGSFFKDDPELNAAYDLVRKSGVSLGSYGNG